MEVYITYQIDAKRLRPIKTPNTIIVNTIQIRDRFLQNEFSLSGDWLAQIQIKKQLKKLFHNRNHRRIVYIVQEITPEIVESFTSAIRNEFGIHMFSINLFDPDGLVEESMYSMFDFVT
jgi:hypothetical protein